ncbi:MAG: 4Fe-4S binding protein [Candidatus Bathyarchaeia archaeon]
MVKITIDYCKCSGGDEEICVEICPASVFRYRKRGKPEIADASNCILCRACQVNCPEQAIKIST